MTARQARPVDANVLVNERATVTAGLANDVELVNQSARARTDPSRGRLGARATAGRRRSGKLEWRDAWRVDGVQG